MRAAIYTRVSSDPTGAARSVDEQETECRRVAEREGWDVAEVFTDNDRSASRYATKDRPNYQRLLTFLEQGRCDVLLAWESSRLTRDLTAFVQLRDLCRDKSVLWSYGGRVLNLADDGDQFSTAIDAVLNERASAETSKRVQRSVRANAAAGRPHGKNLYGYRRVYDGARRLQHVELVDEQAAVLREAAERFLAGESMYALAREFTARDLPAPAGGTVWHPTNLPRLLKNAAYHGDRVHRGEIVGRADWPAVFDDAIWWPMQSRLADPSRRHRRDGAVQHFLSGLAKCGICGGRTSVNMNRGRPAYYCVPGASHLSRDEERADEVVSRAIVARLNMPDAIALLARGDGSDAAAADAADEAQTLRARLDAFVDEAAAGKLSAASLGRLEARLLGEIAAADGRARATANAAALGPMVGITSAQWASLAIPVRREVVRTLATITIEPAGRGRRTFDPALIRLMWK